MIQTREIVNDVTIQVATVNGSGSMSANNLLTKAIFRMGIPVAPKNIFPSNIQGLPTWYTVRVSAQGYQARRKELDVLVAVNRATWFEDVPQVRPGGVVIHEASYPVEGKAKREDVLYYPVPFQKLADKYFGEPKVRKLLMNMIYVGVLAELLGIDDQDLQKAIADQFAGKAKVIEPNVEAVHVGRRYVQENLPKKDPFRLERMQKTEGKILIEGNTACALGAMLGGVTVLTWYPITPSSSVCEALIDYLRAHRHDPKTGKATYAVVQAEDELAAIGMVLGAGWAGARAMTSTSGPGISLMAELTGLGYFAEIPAVIMDIQRIGPSTGLPTRTSQGDIGFVATLSHGDTKHIALLPASMKECFEMSIEAFDLAERFQTPVFVLSDLDLGMNFWMSDPFDYPNRPIDRGKVLGPEDLERLGSFQRYLDVDGDGIPYRTLPGNPHPQASYFTRGSGHNEEAKYTESGEAYQALMDRLGRKYETARQKVPAPVVEREEGARIGIIAYGSTHAAIVECREQLRAQGFSTNYLRIRALPLSPVVREFIGSCDRVYVVEQNRDGQMEDLIRVSVGGLSERIRHVRQYNGFPVDARTISDGIRAQE